MTEIDEVEVISSGGIPFYYHSNSGRETDDAYLLQASFITALSQFASELNNGEVKLISLERKHYLLTKGLSFTVIFTSYHEEGPDKLLEFQPKISAVKDFLDENFKDKGIDPNNPQDTVMDRQMGEFDAFLKEIELVEGDNQYNSSKLRQEVNRFVFNAVGYEPGKCNIGRAERFKRLTFGLIFFSLSFGLYSLILGFNLPIWTVFFLAIPNFFGFLGLFQYFYQFCTTNALSQSYDMN